MTHRGWSNEYELKHNHKKIIQKPMSSHVIRSVNTKEKKSNLVIFASEREVEKTTDNGCMVYLMVAKDDEAGA